VYSMEPTWTQPEWLASMEIGPTTSVNNLFSGDLRFNDLLEMWAIKHGLTMYKTYSSGITNVSAEETIGFIKSLDARLIAADCKAVEGFTNQRYILNSGFLSTQRRLSGFFELTSNTLDEDTAKKIATWGEAHLENRVEDGAVYIITKTSRGFTTTQLGTAGVDLETGNYAPEVITQYKHVIDDFKSADPCGRLVLLTGIPGGGKTYLVR
jgi:hypothetical protein